MAFLLFFIFNFGFPPFLNFWGELGVFRSVVISSIWLGVLVILRYLFSGIYMMGLVVGLTHRVSRPCGSLSSVSSRASWGE